MVPPQINILGFINPGLILAGFIQGLVNVLIEYHHIIGDIISNKYVKVMSKIPRKGHLPSPDFAHRYGTWLEPQNFKQPLVSSAPWLENPLNGGLIGKLTDFWSMASSQPCLNLGGQGNHRTTWARADKWSRQDIKSSEAALNCGLTSIMMQVRYVKTRLDTGKNHQTWIVVYMQTHVECIEHTVITKEHICVGPLVR